jgi:hypothetical protein
MAQAFYTTIPLTYATAVPINVQVGFTPALIMLTDLTSLPTTALPGVAGDGIRAIWQQGMPQGSAIITRLSTLGAGFADSSSYITTNGITLLNPLGSEMGQYGAIISAFTNASPGVITVDSTYNAGITAGSVIMVSAEVDNQAGTSLNGVYYVASVTPTTITLGTPPVNFVYNGQGTISPPSTLVGFGTYISGGFVTVMQNANPTTPFPLNTIYSNVPQWYNQAIQGFTIGTGVFPGATYSLTTPDLILVAAFDSMQP